MNTTVLVDMDFLTVLAVGFSHDAGSLHTVNQRFLCSAHGSEGDLAGQHRQCIAVAVSFLPLLSNIIGG